MPAITSYPVTGDNAKAFRAFNKFGMNLADFAGLTTSSTYDRIGTGGNYTVSNWVSDGVFANLAAAQAVYPIIQDGNDQVDWVLLQSAIDFMIYGSLGSANFGTTKRKLFVPAGLFKINRPLHIGYGSLGTSPADLNGNKYVTVTIEGEGRQADTSGNGMTGTAIQTTGYTNPGIVLSGYQSVRLVGFTLSNQTGRSWLEANFPLYDADGWDVAAYRDSAISSDDNWVGGDAVCTGIGFDLYSTSASAAAYPARVLPASFGGGTTSASAGTAGGTTVEIEDVKVEGFPVGIGRPHGDSNGEFYRLHNVDLFWNTIGFCVGASQARNCSLINVNIEGFHTGITNLGGNTDNANLHGTYQNVHFGRGWQLFEHTLASWSGPLTLRNCYAESFFRIGTWNGPAKFDGCYLSFAEQAGAYGIPYNHAKVARLILDNTSLTGLPNGLHLQVSPLNENTIEIINGSSIAVNVGTSNYAAHADVAKITNGVSYLSQVYMKPGRRSRIIHSTGLITDAGLDNYLNYAGDERSILTYLDQEYTSYSSQHPVGSLPSPAGSDEMQGAVQRFQVPKITKWQLYVDVTSRSGFDLTCSRTAIGDLKADVGDVFGFEPDTGDEDLRSPTWFICVSVTTTEMVLRQQNNYRQTSATNYNVTGYDWVQIGAGTHIVQYICTRIRQSIKLWVGDVTSGSNVISNVKHAFKYGSGDDFTAANFNDPKGMVVGDYFLHQEIERANTGGSGLKVHNKVTGIDFSANTITLTENFNITKVAYPIVFYVKVFNA